MSPFDSEMLMCIAIFHSFDSDARHAPHGDCVYIASSSANWFVLDYNILSAVWCLNKRWSVCMCVLPSRSSWLINEKCNSRNWKPFKVIRGMMMPYSIHFIIILYDLLTICALSSSRMLHTVDEVAWGVCVCYTCSVHIRTVFNLRPFVELSVPVFFAWNYLFEPRPTCTAILATLVTKYINKCVCYGEVNKMNIFNLPSHK